MSYLLAFICVIMCIVDKATGNVLEAGQMAIAAACFTIAGNIVMSKEKSNLEKENQNESEE